MTTRRGFLATILAAGVAPAAVGSGILMPVRPLGSEILLPSWLGVDLASGPDVTAFQDIALPVDVYVTQFGVSVATPPPEMQRIRNEAWAMLAAALPLGVGVSRYSLHSYGPTVKFRRPKR